jgi:gluconolactonase
LILCINVVDLKPSGELIRVIIDYKQPNGIIGTPKGKLLYVADQGSRTIWRYNINSDDTLSNKTFFAPNGSDGMTIDSEGNVYLTSRSVIVYDKNGNKITDIEVPESPANKCFGGTDRKTLFNTAQTSVYTPWMNVKGVE